MEKTCPNCQAQVSFAEVTCPRCGNVLDNIKVSSGNLPENNPVASAKSSTFPMDDSESVIMGKNAHYSPNITAKRNVNLNLIDHTSEEKFDFQWQAVEKDPSAHAPATSKESWDKKDYLKKTQRRGSKDGSKKGTRRIKNKPKRKNHPLYYHIIFFGVPIFIIVGLIAVIVYLRYIKPDSKPSKKQ